MYASTSAPAAAEEAGEAAEVELEREWGRVEVDTGSGTQRSTTAESKKTCEMQRPPADGVSRNEPAPHTAGGESLEPQVRGIQGEAHKEGTGRGRRKRDREGHGKETGRGSPGDPGEGPAVGL